MLAKWMEILTSKETGRIGGLVTKKKEVKVLICTEWMKRENGAVLKDCLTFSFP